MDVLIVLTGRRQHGKDTVADIGVDKFKCAGKVALADWFKKVLANEFRIPLENFYDAAEKDKPLDKPIVLTRPNLRNLVMQLGEHGFNNVNSLSTMKWWGRTINSLRDLMLWFGNEVVTNNCGDTFHCQVTERSFKALKRSSSINAIFVTDARKYEQSKYFVDKFPFVFPVRVIRPGGTDDNHQVEVANDLFPEEYFFETIVNDGSLKDLETKVKDLLMTIKAEVGAKLGKTSTKPITSRKATTEGKKNVNKSSTDRVSGTGTQS